MIQIGPESCQGTPAWEGSQYKDDGVESELVLEADGEQAGG